MKTKHPPRRTTEAGTSLAVAEARRKQRPQRGRDAAQVRGVFFQTILIVKTDWPSAATPGDRPDSIGDSATVTAIARRPERRADGAPSASVSYPGGGAGNPLRLCQV